MDEFLIRSKMVRTSFFRLNKTTRDEFFRGLFQIIDSMSFETDPGYSNVAPTGQAPTTSEECIKSQFSEFEMKIQKIMESNIEISKDISNIWRKLVIQTGKMAGLSGDIESIRNEIQELVRILQIKGERRKGLMKRIQSLTKDIGINTIANLIYDILKIASGS